MDILGIILLSMVGILALLVIGSFIVIAVGVSAYYHTEEGDKKLRRNR